MSRPFDGTTKWWQEEMRQLAQIVHQGHVTEGETWRTCPMASCTRVRDILLESRSDPGYQELPIENVMSLRVRSKAK